MCGGGGLCVCVWEGGGEGGGGVNAREYRCSTERQGLTRV